MITYVQVMIYSQCKIINHKPYWAPKNYNQSSKQLQFIITSERVYVRAKKKVHILNSHLVLHNC